MTGQDSRAGQPEPGRVPASQTMSDPEFARRRAALGQALAEERRESEERAAPPSRRSDFGAGFKLASEFVAGILVGAAIGWAIDYLAGTSPFGLIVFLLLGFAAGVFNVLRATGRMAEPRL